MGTKIIYDDYFNNQLEIGMYSENRLHIHIYKSDDKNNIAEFKFDYKTAMLFLKNFKQLLNELKKIQ